MLGSDKAKCAGFTALLAEAGQSGDNGDRNPGEPTFIADFLASQGDGRAEPSAAIASIR
jgi:hypothetical protein